MQKKHNYTMKDRAISYDGQLLPVLHVYFQKMFEQATLIDDPLDFIMYLCIYILIVFGVELSN